jgi:hypothetical protein
LLLAPPGDVGPDITAYTRIANEQMTQSDFWLRPTSFESNFWAIGYPTFLAMMLRLTGGSLQSVVYVQILLTASLVLVPWFLTRHLAGATKYVAPALLVANPSLWWMGNSIGYEFLLAWLLCVALVLAWSLRRMMPPARGKAIAMAVTCGVLLAAAVLTQTKSIVVIPVVFYLLFKASRPSFWWGCLGLLVGLLPWSLRNIIVMGTPSPFSGNGGYNLWVGNNPDATTGGSMLVAPPTPLGETQMTAALKFITSQPERWIELTWSKAARLLEPVFIYPEAIQAGPGRTALHLLAGLVSLILAVGIVAFLGARLLNGRAVPDVTPLAVFVLLFFLAHVPFIAESRYMTSVLPVTTSVAVAAWLWLGARLRRRDPAEKTVPARMDAE